MWTQKHWQLLFLLSSFFLALLFYKESKTSIRADLPAIEAAQIAEIEEKITVEQSFYQEGRLLLNEAPKEKLVELPGIGSVLADRIIAYREKNGPFQDVNELLRIKGIGNKKLNGFRAKVIVK